jgi:hypothetical protein
MSQAWGGTEWRDDRVLEIARKNHDNQKKQEAAKRATSESIEAAERERLKREGK